jgi:hypothetical protein
VRHKLNQWWFVLLCKLSITNLWHVWVAFVANVSGILCASPRCFARQVSVEFATPPATTSGIHTMFPSWQHLKV